MCVKCQDIRRDPRDQPDVAGVHWGVDFLNQPSSNPQFRLLVKDGDRWHYTGLLAPASQLPDLKRVFHNSLKSRGMV